MAGERPISGRSSTSGARCAGVFVPFGSFRARLTTATSSFRSNGLGKYS
jgi:hypothetical protein